MNLHEQFQEQIRKLLELDSNHDEPETALDHYDLSMSQSDLAFHFWKMGFNFGVKLEREGEG